MLSVKKPGRVGHVKKKRRMSDSENDRPIMNVGASYLATMGGLWENAWNMGQDMAMAPYQAMAESAMTSPAYDIWTPRGQGAFLSQFPAYRYWETMVDAGFSRWSAAREERKDRAHAPDAEMPTRSIEQEMEFLPRVIRTLVKSQLLFNPMARAALENVPMESDGMAAVLEMVCGRMPGEGELYKPAYNNRFLSENAQGDVQAVDGDDIVKRFQQHDWDAQADFPRIIITSSHARAKSVNDMREITHGIAAMTRDASDGKALDITPADAPTQPGQTLMLFACDTERNSGLNAARLIRRVNELRRSVSGDVPDAFAEISPGAKRIAKLMLKCMAENPQQVGDINSPLSLRDTMPANGRLVLREDAARIAQHFQLIGYSKGGNVVSDAMRYLVSELTSKGRNGNDLVRIYSEMEPRPINDFGTHGVRSLMRNVGFMSIAAREVSMSKHLRDCGVRRVAFNNRHDSIAFFDNYPHRPRDENWVIEGSAAKLGHDPIDAMGSDTASGYMVGDARVKHRLKEFMAPHYGKAAVGHVLFDETDGEFNVKFVVAPGTSDELFLEHENTILAALSKAGIANPRLVHTNSNVRSFELESDEDFQHDARAVKKLQQAFKDLRKPTVKGLVIGDAILTEDIPQHMAKVGGPKAAQTLQKNLPDGPAL